MLVSAFGPKATALAAGIGDGFVTTASDADAIRLYRGEGGRGPAVAAVKVGWAIAEGAGRKLAYDTRKTTAVPGELNQELPMPAHFEQAAANVTEDMAADKIACGPDPERHRHAIGEYLDAGFDQIYVSQIGEDPRGFLDFFFRKVHPKLGI